MILINGYKEKTLSFNRKYVRWPRFRKSSNNKKYLNIDPMNSLNFLNELDFKFLDLNSNNPKVSNFDSLKNNNITKLTNFICIKE